VKYEFYIDTGDLRWQPGFTKPISKMICINIIRKKVSNKRDRLKKALMFPSYPKQVISVNKTWCFLSKREKEQYIKLTDKEFKNLIIQWNI